MFHRDDQFIAQLLEPGGELLRPGGHACPLDDAARTLRWHRVDEDPSGARTFWALISTRSRDSVAWVVSIPASARRRASSAWDATCWVARIRAILTWRAALVRIARVSFSTTPPRSHSDATA